jgi:hypothetical protein
MTALPARPGTAPRSGATAARPARGTGLLAIGLAAATCAAGIGAGTAGRAEPTAPLTRVVVSAAGAGAAGVSAAAAAVAAAGGTVLDHLPLVDGVSAELPAGTALAPGFSVVEDRPVQLASGAVASAAAPMTVRQALALGAPAQQGLGTTIAVVDTGVHAHPDLAGRLTHVDVTGSSAGAGQTSDGYGHGTFVAGVAAGDGGADGTYAGVAPGADVLDVRVAAADGSTDLVTVLAGLEQASARGADVVNLSLSSYSPLPWQVDPLTVALTRMWESGTVVVVPAGNDGPESGTITSPGIAPALLTVGALDTAGTESWTDDVVADFSARGPAPQGVAKPELVAPGRSVVSLRAHGSLVDTANPQARVGEDYFRGSGTSFATAAAAGAAAVLLAGRPELAPGLGQGAAHRHRPPGPDHRPAGRRSRRAQPGRRRGSPRPRGRVDAALQAGQGQEGHPVPRRPVAGARRARAVEAARRRAGHGRRRGRRQQLVEDAARRQGVGGPQLGRPAGRPAGRAAQGLDRPLVGRWHGPGLGRHRVGRSQLGGQQLERSQLGGEQLERSQLGRSQLGGPQLGRSQLGGSQLGRTQLGRPELGRTQLGRSQLGHGHVDRRRLGRPVGVLSRHRKGPSADTPAGPTSERQVLRAGARDSGAVDRRDAGSRARELRRVVLAAALLAVGLQLAVDAVVYDHAAVAPLQQAPAWLTMPVLMAALLCLGVAAELYAVRIRHGEAAEELTLVEAAVVACALLLPPVQAMLVPVLASIVSSLLRRRSPVKLAFNAAVVGAGSALVVAALHALSSPGVGMNLRTVAAMTVGMVAFAALNLVLVARVLATVSDVEPGQVVREGLRLSAVMALGTTGLGATAVTLASAAPALLPFSVLPAAALMFAYRAAQQETEERERSSRLLALSQVLAGRLEDDAMLESFLRLTRQAFGADVATALLCSTTTP